MPVGSPPYQRTGHKLTRSDTASSPIAQLRGQYFRDYYLSVSDIFDNHHITTIVNFANRTKRLIVPEELDQTGVT